MDLRARAHIVHLLNELDAGRGRSFSVMDQAQIVAQAGWRTSVLVTGGTGELARPAPDCEVTVNAALCKTRP